MQGGDDPFGRVPVDVGRAGAVVVRESVLRGGSRLADAWYSSRGRRSYVLDGIIS